jgi:uncharacterized protein involved in exopolysaccharide biosynthesis
MMRRFSPRAELATLASIAPRFVRAAWVGGIALALGLAGTAVWTLSTKRLYRSEAVLLYERGAQATLGREGESPRAIAARLQEMLTSRQRLDALIREMRLYQGLIERRGLVETVDEMRRRIAINNREGYTFRVSYDGESRDLAKDVLTRLTASVVEEDGKRRNQDAEEARRFLDTERKQADEDLKQKEKTLAEFLTRHPQLAAEAGAATTGGLIRAADRDRMGASGGGEVASLELQAAQLEESLAAAGAPRTIGGRIVPTADPQLTAAHQRAQTELQAAQRDLGEKQTHLTNEHPDMKQALRRVATAEIAERRAAAALAAWRPPAGVDAPTTVPDDPSASGRVAALRRALAAVRQQIAAVKGRSAPRTETPRAPNAAVAIDTEWTRLNRDVAEARERQGNLEAKQFQAQLTATLTAGGQGGQLVVADPPFRPMRPIAGGRLKIAMVGGVGSVVFALVVIGLFAWFDDRLYAAHDVESVLGDGIVVVIPKVVPRLAPVPAPIPEQRAEES